MVSPSSLLRLLSFSARPPGRPSERKIQHVRDAMLQLLQRHEGQSFHRVAQRIQYADEMECLWYLRQDMLAALSEVHGEARARREMRQINDLFKGLLPHAMVARPHHRFAN
ncbi:MAG: hypothetical protein AAGD03_09535 [Bordetella sp.]|nr:hypothetical protein [Pseudomonadota bacterium]